MSRDDRGLFNAALLAGSMVATALILRLFLHQYPQTDLNIGAYNVHHLYSGMILVVVAAVPLAIYGNGFRRARWWIGALGCGLGMALDEWVYLIATDGSNQAYLEPVSWIGALLLIGATLLYVTGWLLRPPR